MEGERSGMEWDGMELELISNGSTNNISSYTTRCIQTMVPSPIPETGHHKQTVIKKAQLKAYLLKCANWGSGP
jgi:hypothetical protein